MACDYPDHLISTDKCKMLRTLARHRNNPFHDCNCLQLVKEVDTIKAAVAECLVEFSSLSSDKRKSTLMDWIRHSAACDNKNDDNKRRFFLPICNYDQNMVSVNTSTENQQLRDHKTCKAALGCPFNFRHERWCKCKSAVHNNQTLTHGNKNRLPANVLRFNNEV